MVRSHCRLYSSRGKAGDEDKGKASRCGVRLPRRPPLTCDNTPVKSAVVDCGDVSPVSTGSKTTTEARLACTSRVRPDAPSRSRSVYTVRRCHFSPRSGSQDLLASYREHCCSGGDLSSGARNILQAIDATLPVAGLAPG